MANKVLTIGTFDILHYGHLHFLQQCSTLGDELIVGVNSDEFVEEFKDEAPIMTTEERVKALSVAGYPLTGVNAGSGRDFILETHPDILAVGSDWARRDYLKQIDMTQDELDELGISLIYIPYTQAISTTEIKRRCRQSL